MKQKTKIVLMLLLGALIFSVLLCTNQVQATTEVTDILNKIPNTIEVNNVVKDDMHPMDSILGNKDSKRIEEIQNKIKSYIKDTPDANITVGFHWNDSYIIDTNVMTVELELNGLKYNKVINIKYNNSNWNNEDKEYIKNHLTNIKKETTVQFDIEECIKSEQENTFDNYYNKIYLNHLKENNILQDNNIECKYYPMEGDWEWEYYDGTLMRGFLTISKNGTVYYLCSVRMNGQASISIPSNIESTEEIIKYAKNKIEEYVKEQDTINKNASTSNDVIYTPIGYEKVVVKQLQGNIYSVSNEETKELLFKVLLNKEKETNISTKEETTGIKLDTNSSIVSKFVRLDGRLIKDIKTLTTTTVNDKIINTIENVITKEYQAWNIYDINLLQDEEKVQPNGKVKLSIPIPNGWDKSRLKIFRIAESGEKIEYEVKVEGNYATFETDHFSIYVIAEEKTSAPSGAETTTTVETPKHEKDETPKTGTVDIMGYVLAVTTLAGIGLIAIRERK